MPRLMVRDNEVVIRMYRVGHGDCFLLAMPHQNLLPVFSADVWDVGAVGLGLLQTLAGVGGLAGAIVAANLSGTRKPGRLLMASMVLFAMYSPVLSGSPLRMAANHSLWQT